jgi:hypothetical protein
MSGTERRPQRLFVAAPHSHCEAKEYRDCDLVAEPAARAIINAGGDMIVGTHLSDRLRALGDYNRPVTDAEPWRVALREAIAAARPDFVLEIHSFPGNYETFARDWPGADLALFKSPANAHFVDRLAHMIREAAREMIPPPNVQVVVAGHPNAIMDDMAAMGQPHTLFEFNEDMDRARIEPLARAVLGSVAELAADGSTQAPPSQKSKVVCWLGCGVVSGGCDCTGSVAALMIGLVIILIYFSASAMANRRRLSYGRGVPLFPSSMAMSASTQSYWPT